MKRRVIAAVLAVGALATVLSLPADAKRPSEESRPCADITGAFIRWDADDQTTTFHMLTEAPSCPSAWFVLRLYDEEDSRRPVTTIATNGNRSTNPENLQHPIPFSFRPEDPTSDSIYCAVGTSRIGRHRIDRAPDSERLCFVATRDDDLGRGRSFR